MTAKTRVYVAGPLSKGDVAMNVRLACKAGFELLSHGYSPFVPHLTHLQHMLYPMPYEAWMEQDRQWLLLCHAMLRLPGESAGAQQEELWAIEAGIPVFRTTLELFQHLPASERNLTAEQRHRPVLDNVQALRNGCHKSVAESPSQAAPFQEMVGRELDRARAGHNPINSLHEGWAVIYEEVDELWDLVRLKREDRQHGKVLKELIQIGAICQRTAEDLELVPPPEPTIVQH